MCVVSSWTDETLISCWFFGRVFSCNSFCRRAYLVRVPAHVNHILNDSCYDITQYCCKITCYKRSRRTKPFIVRETRHESFQMVKITSTVSRQACSLSALPRSWVAPEQKTTPGAGDICRDLSLSGRWGVTSFMWWLWQRLFGKSVPQSRGYYARLWEPYWLFLRCIYSCITAIIIIIN